MINPYEQGPEDNESARHGLLHPSQDHVKCKDLTLEIASAITLCSW